MDLNKIAYLLITGASKGIGKTMAIECSKKLKANSVIVLLARTKSDLENTKTAILNVTSNVKVIIYPIDLSTSTSDDFAKILNDSLIDYNKENFELTWIIHNAASAGDVSKKAVDLININEWNKYYCLNLFSVAALNGEFMKTFSCMNDKNKLIVNITSKASKVPFKSFALYCSGKASREMYFRVLAAEQPDLKVLNYSPGPVDTEMANEVISNTYDDSIREAFKNRAVTNEILTTLQTTEKFIKILETYSFESGDHVEHSFKRS